MIDKVYKTKKCLICNSKYKDSFHFLYLSTIKKLLVFCEECFETKITDKPKSERDEDEKHKNT